MTIGRLRWVAGIAVATSLLNHVLGGVLGKVAIKALRWRETLGQLARGAVMSTVCVVAAGLHIHVFDRLFLRMGRLKSVLAGLDSVESEEKAPGESAE